MTLPVLVINLEGSEARLASARAQLEAAGLEFQRLPAFDGRGLTPDAFPDYDPQAARAHMGRPLRGGEIGCYLSHLAAARRIAEGTAPVAVVLEDDMRLTPEAAEALRALVDWAARASTDWDVINLGPNKHKIFTPLADLPSGHRLTRAHYFPMTTTGLMWSREGAAAFVAAHHRIWAPVDNYFRHWQTRRGRGLAVWPPLVTTSGAESEISAASGPKRSAEGRHPLYGFIKQRRLLTDKLIALAHKLRG